METLVSLVLCVVLSVLCCQCCVVSVVLSVLCCQCCVGMQPESNGFPMHTQYALASKAEEV